MPVFDHPTDRRVRIMKQAQQIVIQNESSKEDHYDICNYYHG